jgi:hypothetical protein
MLWRASTHGFERELNLLVCVCLEPSLANSTRDKLENEANQFLLIAKQANEQVRVFQRTSPRVDGGSLRETTLGDVLRRRDRLIEAYAAKLTDHRWRRPDVFEAVFWQKAPWAYTITHAFDDPSQ